jgi:hypothetical protein
MSAAPSAVDRLGLPEFTFADLHEPARLADLYGRFIAEVVGTEPALWERWQAQAAAPPGPVDRSALLVALAPHVSRFIAKLFAVGPEAEVLAATTRAYDDLFRFKIDFVRRRALPLSRAARRCPVTAEDHAYVDAILAGAADAGARELLVAPAARCSIATRPRARSGDESAKAALAAEIDALKRWCAAHLRHPALPRLGDLQVPRDARLRAPRAHHAARTRRCRTWWPGPTRCCAAATASRSPTRALDARGAERESLLRALPRARQGLVQQGHQGPTKQGALKIAVEPARHRAERLPARREDLRDAPAAQARRRCSARSPS